MKNLLLWLSTPKNLLLSAAIIAAITATGIGIYFLFVYFPTATMIGFGIIGGLVALAAIGYVIRHFSGRIGKALRELWINIKTVFQLIGKLLSGTFVVVGALMVIAIFCGIIWLAYLWNPIAGIVVSGFLLIGTLLYLFRNKIRAYRAARKAARTTAATTTPKISWFKRIKIWYARVRASRAARKAARATAQKKSWRETIKKEWNEFWDDESTTSPGLFHKETMKKWGIPITLVVGGIIYFLIFPPIFGLPDWSMGSLTAWFSNPDNWPTMLGILLVLLIAATLLALFSFGTPLTETLIGAGIFAAILVTLLIWKPWEDKPEQQMADTTGTTTAPTPTTSSQTGVDTVLNHMKVIVQPGASRFVDIKDGRSWTSETFAMDSIAVVTAKGDTLWGFKKDSSGPHFYTDKKGVHQVQLPKEMDNVFDLKYTFLNYSRRAKSVHIIYGPKELVQGYKKS